MHINSYNVISFSPMPNTLQEAISQRRTHGTTQKTDSKELNFSDLTLKCINDSDSGIYKIDDLNAFVYEQTKYEIAIRDAVYNTGDLTASATAYNELLTEITQQYASDTESFTKAKSSLDTQYEHFATNFSNTLSELTSFACGTGSIQDHTFKFSLTREQRVQIATDTKLYLMNTNPSLQSIETQENPTFTQDDITNLVQIFYGDKKNSATHLNNFLNGITTNTNIASSLKDSLKALVVS